MTQKILVVDDEEDILFLYREELTEAGYQVFTANNGMNALTVLDEQGTVDLVVTDIKMPEIGGLGLVPYLRSRRPGIPVIVVTAFPQYRNILTAEGSNVKAFFTKPLDFRELRAKVAEILGSDKKGG